jgi:uncharacterized protein with gpF-like domain
MISRAAGRVRGNIAAELRDGQQAIADAVLAGDTPARAMDEHARRLEPIIESAWSDSANRFAARLEGLIDRARKNDEREARIRDWIARHLGKQAQLIADTTVKRVTDRINRGLSDGLSISEIADQLRDEFPAMAATRAAMIARTEVQAAAQAGQLESARASGLALFKEWVSSGDSRVRSFADGRFSHRQADGETVPMDEPFVMTGESLDHPGAFGGSPGNIINCRCSAIYNLPE